MRRFKPLILLAALVLGFFAWQTRHAPAPGEHGGNRTTASQHSTPATPLPGFLPAEARNTLNLIVRRGPFEHRQDGGVFGNYEGLLPKQPCGYYHEYTVETPGARNRGARRIITGGTPPVVWYYTGDHYRSFRRLEVNR